MASTIGINDNGVMQATRGAIFIGPAETLIDKTSLSKFKLDAASVTVAASGSSAPTFVNMGHMSNDTLPEFSLSGGDATSLDTWMKAQFRTSYDATTGTVTMHSVQGDKGTLKTLYNAVDTGSGVGVAFSLEKTPINKSLFILWEDTNISKRAGLLLPNVDIAFSSLPTLNQSAFNEFEAQANIKTSSKLPKDSAGKYCSVAVFDADDFTLSA